MSPGAYLRKRREAAGLSLREVTCMLVRQPEAMRPVSEPDLRQLALFLGGAEADDDNLTVPQASLLGRLYRFDIGIYEALLLRHHGVPVPVPQVCRSCGCSWLDACETAQGPCSWAAPDLCSACAQTAARGRTARFAPIDWPDAPHPTGATA